MPRLTDEQQRDFDSACALLSRYTKHAFVRLTNSGNGAIFAALALAKQAGVRRAFVPDQGGWFSYRTYPQMLGLHLHELKTDVGILDPLDLSDELSKYSSSERCCLLVPSFAGYFAEQDIRELAGTCHEHGALLIEDAAGSLSDERLCDGTYSDIIVASFGAHKLVNLGYGGMISSRTGVEGAGEVGSLEEHPVFSLTRFPQSMLSRLVPALESVPERLKTLLRRHRKILKELCSEDIQKIVHEKGRGINIAVQCEGDERDRVQGFCKQHAIPWMRLPRYHRARIPGVSLELKRI